MPLKVSEQLAHAKSLLDEVAQQLLMESWLKRDFHVSVHYFPQAPESPQSVTIHVYRQHWYNEDRQGIHFEAHVGVRELAKKQVPLMLHLFHTATIAGTTIKRIKVSKPFVDNTRSMIESWPGYRFRRGCYGTQPFSCTIAFANEKELVDLLSAELKKLCRELAPQIDQALAQALDSD